MRLQSQPAFSCRDLRVLSILLLIPIFVLSAGCEEEERNVGDKPKPGRSQASNPAKPEFIVGKRTQEIRNASTEINKDGVLPSRRRRSPRKTRSPYQVMLMSPSSARHQSSTFNMRSIFTRQRTIVIPGITKNS